MSEWQDLKVSVAVTRDDEMEAFGAYLSPSVLEGEAVVRINIGAMLLVDAMEGIPFKETFMETVMHEVGHAMEQCLGLPFDEERVERLSASYRERYGGGVENVAG